MATLAKIELALASFDQNRYMKDFLSYRGASLWNFVNYGDKEGFATLNFNQLRERVSVEDYFIDLKFECTSTSAIRCRQQNFIHFWSLCTYNVSDS